ncbi:hypothetical protein C8F04DRAFT_1408943 [Mycena alexandri]|uniref:Uncharacterized protein n=1 Tax=Mycena alexandri TaxID=1745969 RepID=A0AAD6WP75_9AGAR|nr:hypothetical protein C8F04DRAFT_1408943 [Mycena alexandri]
MLTLVTTSCAPPWPTNFKTVKHSAGASARENSTLAPLTTFALARILTLHAEPPPLSIQAIEGADVRPLNIPFLVLLYDNPTMDMRGYVQYMYIVFVTPRVLIGEKSGEGPGNAPYLPGSGDIAYEPQ